MRPVVRGANPQAGDYDPYRDAFGPLVGRLGCYCSYCERRIPTQLAVEHVQPKGLPQYAHLIGRWDNYLLGCVNCNGTKGDKDVLLDAVLLPDRDNTAAAFAYTLDGKVQPQPSLTPDQAALAWATLKLVGLEKPVSQVMDENGQMVAVDRVSQRMETWLMAESSKDDLSQCAPAAQELLRRQIVKTAQTSGHFSIWMTVFAGDEEMRRMLIDGFHQDGVFYGFEGTARDCFDANTRVISPRPSVPGLLCSGKI